MAAVTLYAQKLLLETAFLLQSKQFYSKKHIVLASQYPLFSSMQAFCMYTFDYWSYMPTFHKLVALMVIPGQDSSTHTICYELLHGRQ